MLNSGKKNPASRAKKINILTLVLFEKKFLNETKNHNPPPLQVKWSVPYQYSGRAIAWYAYHDEMLPMHLVIISGITGLQRLPF